MRPRGIEPRRRRADTPHVERSRRSYFLLLGVACVLGWSTGLWGLPLVAFALLELAWTAAEHVRGRDRSRRRYVR